MIGAFAFEHRVVVDRMEGRKMIRHRPAQLGWHLAPHAPVAQHGVHRRMGGGDWQIVVFPQDDIAQRTGPGVERIGVLDEGRICR